MILRETQGTRARSDGLEWVSTLPALWAGDAMMATLDRRLSSMLGTRQAVPAPDPPPSSVRSRRPDTTGLGIKRRVVRN